MTARLTTTAAGSTSPIGRCFEIGQDAGADRQRWRAGSPASATRQQTGSKAGQPVRASGHETARPNDQVVGTVGGERDQRDDAAKDRVPVEHAGPLERLEVRPERNEEVPVGIERNAAHDVAEGRAEEDRRAAVLDTSEDGVARPAAEHGVGR